MIRNRCSGGQRVRRTDRVDLLCEWRERHLGAQEAPRCCLGDRRLRGTELSLYPPVIVTVWDDTAAQERFGGNFFVRVACGVVEWTGIPRHHILFQLPIKPTTVKWLLVCTPEQIVADGFLSNERLKQNWTTKCALILFLCNVLYG